MTFFALILFLVSLAAVVWISMTLAGFNKGPVLATFERYGPELPYYFPLPALLLAMGLLVGAFGILIREVFVFATPFEIAGGLLILLSAVAWNQQERIEQIVERLPTLPRWYGHLKEYTSRYERRRIAYMWLRLPPRTRLLYNANHQAFFAWADLIVMATIRES